MAYKAYRAGYQHGRRRKLPKNPADSDYMAGYAKGMQAPELTEWHRDYARGLLHGKKRLSPTSESSGYQSGYNAGLNLPQIEIKKRQPKTGKQSPEYRKAFTDGYIYGRRKAKRRKPFPSTEYEKGFKDGYEAGLKTHH